MAIVFAIILLIVGLGLAFLLSTLGFYLATLIVPSLIFSWPAALAIWVMVVIVQILFRVILGWIGNVATIFD